ncbi:MAG: ribosome assembly factor SBDS [Candidatus Nanoarchaeia archaeon]|nr:ribosome assembly factor SBDS [Candidatus Nanoarchaeia archaeon]
MVNVEEASTAKLTMNGKTFEILVDCEKAMDFKKGKIKNVSEAIVTDEVFKDLKKGYLASEQDLREIFKTANPEIISKEILMRGEIQVTAEYRNKERELKRNKIIEIIRTNAINPQTSLPHPADRIKSAMEQARVNIDEHRQAEEQVQDVLKKINPILPIKFETRQVQVVIPSKYSAQSYNVLHKFGKISNEDWLSNGSLSAVLEIPAGIQEDLEKSVYALTHGEAEIKILTKK